MFRTLVGLYFIIKIVSSENILFVNSYKTYSHFNTFRKIALALTEIGHNVTVIAPLDFKNTHANLTKIYINNSIDMTGVFKEALDVLKKSINYNIVHATSLYFDKQFLEHDLVQNLLNANDSYDMVVVNDIFSTTLYGFCSKYKAICVSVFACHNEALRNIITGYPMSFLLFLKYHGLESYSTSFIGRVQLVLQNIHYLLLWKYIYFPTREKLHKEIFGVNDLQSTIADISLTLENTNVYFHQPVPTQSNIIQISGFHLEKSKGLPKDLQEFMDKSVDGVIYMSMGSVIAIPENVVEVFIKAFTRIKINVLWKANYLKVDLPKNVKVFDWVSQTDILEHPNTKMFITHCGILSTYEALFSGVPIVAVPIIWDQLENAKFLVERFNAKVISYFNPSEDLLVDAINDILGNKSYKEKALEFSKLFRSVPIDPLKNTVSTLENLLKYGKATHLKMSSSDLEWYEFYNIDLILFTAFILLLQTYLFYKLVLRCLNCFGYFK